MISHTGRASLFLAYPSTHLLVFAVETVKLLFWRVKRYIACSSWWFIITRNFGKNGVGYSHHASKQQQPDKPTRPVHETTGVEAASPEINWLKQDTIAAVLEETEAPMGWLSKSGVLELELHVARFVKCHLKY